MDRIVLALHCEVIYLCYPVHGVNNASISINLLGETRGEAFERILRPGPTIRIGTQHLLCNGVKSHDLKKAPSPNTLGNWPFGLEYLYHHLLAPRSKILSFF